MDQFVHFVAQQVESIANNTRLDGIHLNLLVRNLSLFGITCTMHVPVKHLPGISDISAVADLLVWSPNTSIGKHCIVIKVFHFVRNLDTALYSALLKTVDIVARIHKNLAAVDGLIIINLSKAGYPVHVLGSKHILTLDCGYPFVLFQDYSAEELEGMRNQWRNWYFGSKKKGFYNERLEVYKHVQEMQETLLPKQVRAFSIASSEPLDSDPDLRSAFDRLCDSLEL